MRHFLIFLIIILFTCETHAQLENIIVETYYISDSTDASDTTNGFLYKGSATYRIYADLAPGYKLTKIFGNVNHDLKISSTLPFFNTLNGETFGNKITKLELTTGIGALDTWLTMGQTYAKKVGKTGYGVLKKDDNDGSFITLLTNNDPLAGIPLLTSDGIYTSALISPPTFFHYGIVDEFSNVDSTIFGSIVPKTEFNSKGKEVNLTTSAGVSGVIPSINQVLIAQLTTKGKIAFELNLELSDSTNGKKFTYVAKNSADSTSTIYSPLLKYPSSCGCMDPHYLEYSQAFICDDSKACKTRIVCGCTDPLACNYDSNANVNIPALCCYPGFCNDRDISIVCPSISNSVELTIFPNPAEDQLTLQVSGGNEDKEVKYAIYDAYGLLKTEKSKITIAGALLEQIDVSAFPTGVYWLRLTVDSTTTSKLFMKK